MLYILINVRFGVEAELNCDLAVVGVSQQKTTVNGKPANAGLKQIDTKYFFNQNKALLIL